MRLGITAAVVACLGLAACASPRAPRVSLPPAYEAPQPAADQAAVPLDRWWTAFEDAQLSALIDEALARSPDIGVAAARLREARASRVSALVAFLPQGEARSQARRTQSQQIEGPVITVPGFANFGRSDTYQSNFDVSWEVDLFGRIFAAGKAANAEVAAARFSLEGVRASLAASVADAYFQARGLAIQLEDAQETARIRRSLLDVTQARAVRGLTAASDADRVAGDLSQAEAQVEALTAELQATRRTLLILVGRGTDPLASLPAAAEPAAIPPAPQSLPGDLLARRPDVREAEERLNSQLGRLGVARRAFFPTFTLTPGLGLSRTVQPGFESTTSNWSIGGSVSVPVLNIPRLLADLKAQDARTEQAVFTYEKTVQTAYGEAESALVRLEAQRRQVAVLTDGERRAQRAYQAARIRYDRGLDGLEQALSAEQAWRATRAQLTSARVQALRQTVQSYKAVGGGWSDPRALPRTATP